MYNGSQPVKTHDLMVKIFKKYFVSGHLQIYLGQIIQLINILNMQYLIRDNIVKTSHFGVLLPSYTHFCVSGTFVNKQTITMTITEQVVKYFQKCK